MKPTLFACAAAGFLLLGNTALGGDEKIQASSYFPLQVGTKWTYRLGEDKVHIHVARHEKIGDELCAVLESVKDGKVIETETVAVRKDGIYRLATDDGKLNPPLLFLRLPPRRGDSWKSRFQVEEATVSGTFTIDEEEVQLPAGKFRTVLTRGTDFEVNGTKFSMIAWYASGVGPVKKWAKLGKVEMLLELEKFEPAK